MINSQHSRLSLSVQRFAKISIEKPEWFDKQQKL